SRTRRLIETHRDVFTRVLERMAPAGLVKDKPIGIDKLEVNAALRSVVHRETAETYQEFLKKLAQASGIKTPTRAALARLTGNGRRKGWNRDWNNPHDPHAKITNMGDSRTHFAHKVEHAVDPDTG